MASVGIGRTASDLEKPKKRSPVEDMYDVYGNAVKKQAGDYDDIMQRFKDIYSSTNNPSNYQFDPVQAEQTTYNKSSDTTRALAELQDLASTGGLNDAAQQNLRARGVSPIRAQYATAQRDMDRQRSLQGGNSANFGAVTAKMTRDQSSLIADQMDKVNANIAQMVQSGRLSAAPNYASAAQAESSLKHGIATDNTRARNETNRFNASGMFDAKRQQKGDRLSAASGMANLYGTTPALANLYGDQAYRASESQIRSKQNTKKDAIDLIGRTYRA